LVQVQKSKIIQVIVNLVKNGIEAMNSTDNTKKLTIVTEQDKKNVWLKVSDTGCGISKESLSKIFTHGYTTKKHGHGFGLHTSANYMTEMYGKMWAESDGVGKGATFVLQFPKRAK